MAFIDYLTDGQLLAIARGYSRLFPIMGLIFSCSVGALVGMWLTPFLPCYFTIPIGLVIAGRFSSAQLDKLRRSLRQYGGLTLQSVRNYFRKRPENLLMGPLSFLELAAVLALVGAVYRKLKNSKNPVEEASVTQKRLWRMYDVFTVLLVLPYIVSEGPACAASLHNTMRTLVGWARGVLTSLHLVTNILSADSEIGVHAEMVEEAITSIEYRPYDGEFQKRAVLIQRIAEVKAKRGLSPEVADDALQAMEAELASMEKSSERMMPTPGSSETLLPSLIRSRYAPGAVLLGLIALLVVTNYFLKKRELVQESDNSMAAQATEEGKQGKTARMRRQLIRAAKKLNAPRRKNIDGLWYTYNGATHGWDPEIGPSNVALSESKEIPPASEQEVKNEGKQYYSGCNVGAVMHCVGIVESIDDEKRVSFSNCLSCRNKILVPLHALGSSKEITVSFKIGGKTASQCFKLQDGEVSKELDFVIFPMRGFAHVPGAAARQISDPTWALESTAGGFMYVWPSREEFYSNSPKIIAGEALGKIGKLGNLAVLDHRFDTTVGYCGAPICDKSGHVIAIHRFGRDAPLPNSGVLIDQILRLNLN